MRKYLLIILTSVLILQNNEAKSSEIFDQFLFKPALTVELQGPELRAKSKNSGFETEPFEKQLKTFDNIALGLNFRIHKYLGFNVNWSKFALESDELNGYSLTKKSDLTIKQVNFSSLFYLPLMGDDLLDAFIEIGASDVNFDLKFYDATTGLNAIKDHETALLYGAGLELTPYDSQTAFRLTFQRYLTKLKPINGDIVAVRLGIVQYF